jgi:hypothetical protein
MRRLAKMLGVPDDSPISKMMDQVQKLTMMIRMMHTSAVMVQAASGPIGLAMAGVSIGTTALMGMEMSGSFLEGY